MLEKIRSNNAYKLLLCAGVSVLMAVIIYFHYELLMDTDDIGIRSILSGLYTGTPEAHVLFFLYPLSFILSKLYTFSQGIQWYFWFFEVSNYACLTLILFSVVRRLKKYILLFIIIFTALFFIFWIPNLIQLEWTTTAGLLSATAIVWFFFIPVETDKKKLVVDYAIPIFLFALSFNLRSSVLEMALPFMIMAILIKWFWNIKDINKKNIRKDLIFIGLTVVVLVGSYEINRAAYSSDEWMEASAYSNYRAMLYDRYGYPSYDEYSEVYEENGITEEMYEVMKTDYNFMLASKGVLTSESLRPIAELAKENYYAQRTTIGELKHCLKERWQNMWNDNYKVYTIVFYAGILLLIICAIYRRAWFHLFLEVVSVIGFEALWLYLYYGARLPVRVGRSLYLLGFILVMAFLFEEPLVHKIWHYRWAQIVAILIVAVLFWREAVIIQGDNELRAYRASYFQEIMQYCEDNSENVYFRDVNSNIGTGISYEKIKDKSDRLAANYVPPNGWMVSLPLDNQFMPTDGSQELCSWISEQNNFYLIVNSDRADGVCLRTENLFQSRGIDCTLELEDVFQTSNDMTLDVYHFSCG